MLSGILKVSQRAIGEMASGLQLLSDKSDYRRVWTAKTKAARVLFHMTEH